MTHDQPRTDGDSRDRSPDHQYSLSVEQTAELFAAARHLRTMPGRRKVSDARQPKAIEGFAKATGMVILVL
jgi:hypothetical protein